jgi:predicted alpha-1,2-mannosidase
MIYDLPLLKIKTLLYQGRAKINKFSFGQIFLKKYSFPLHGSEFYRKFVSSSTLLVMKMSLLWMTRLAVMFLIACSHSNRNASTIEDLTRYVNPLVGTDGHGHTFPGASLPFGMVQLSPDTRLEGWDGCGGYHYSDSVVYGFSHTHLSGTGVPDYCDILFMPTTGEVKLNNGAGQPGTGYSSGFAHSNEKAEAGYYQVFLKDYGINAELTSTRRAGMHRYRFLTESRSNVIIDLTHRDKVLGSEIEIINDSTVAGYRRSSYWANDQHVYFYAVFSKSVIESGIQSDEKLTGDNKATGTNLKAYLTFDTEENKTLLIKVGISAVSAAGAKNNLEKEIPGWDFDKVRSDAKESWNKELGKIRITDQDISTKTTFYTALYHAFLVPNLFMDADGSYRGRDQQIHKAEGFDYCTVFSLWDTFRGEHPLFTITQQKRTNDFIQTMIAQYEQGGRLPVWELAANETECMIGYHSIPVIVDAYMKGIRGFDLEKAFEAMKHSAMLDHFGLKSYKEHGYIPAEDEAESVSRTLEYAYDDWCIAVMAKAMGKEEDYRVFMDRAQSYKNIFDPATGFMRAKMNGRWFEPFDPKEVNFNYTEANSWQYSFFVPQDIHGLAQMMGGNEKLAERLDKLFSESTETTGREQSDITGLIGQYAHGNEPSHHMAYLYNYVGQPWKTQEITRKIMDHLYTPKPDGLCGNEDCGQMSAWYVLSALGFYPVTPGEPVYTFGSPVFEEAMIHLENGKTFGIITRNSSPENKFIQRIRLNGKKLERMFITHEEIMRGGEIEFEMGHEPNKSLGIRMEDQPVSAITDKLITPVPFIGTGSRTFIDSTIISLGSIAEGSDIFYTTDGSEPDMRSNKYTEPFVLNKSATIKAISYKEGTPVSKSLTAEFHKIPVGRKISLKTRFANQYSAGGDLALIDFIRGSANFRTGAWQGYEGVDLDAVIDLGSIQLISGIEAGFLQDVGAWIFYPERVGFFVSTDGVNFLKTGTAINDVSLKDTQVQIKNFTANFTTKARYIKIVARNIGVCPEWHWGTGGKAWIFADEIVIK